MKAAVIILSVLASTLASPIEETIDWHNIQPNDIRVETDAGAPRITGTRIIGGQVAPRNSLPYQVATIVDNSGFCGGSLISPDVVLSAAHCFDRASQIQVILGAHNPRAVETSQRIQNTREFIVHERWSRITMQNDLGVIRIARVGLTPEIQLIALAPANAPSYAGQTAVLSGWGRTSDSATTIASELKRVNLQVIDNDVCRATFGVRLQPQHICTSGQGRVGGCNGDSGGPLVVQGVQVGIVSFGSRDCEAQLPTAFARVSFFRDWIRTFGGV